GMPRHVGEGISVSSKTLLKKPKIDYPLGASMIVSKYVLKKLGLLSEDYFLFFEELDWASRLKKIGGRVEILNFFGVYHKLGASTKSNKREQSNIFMEMLFIKNRILNSKKHNKEFLWSTKIDIYTITLIKKIYRKKFAVAKQIALLFFK